MEVKEKTGKKKEEHVKKEKEENI